LSDLNTILPRKVPSGGAGVGGAGGTYAVAVGIGVTVGVFVGVGVGVSRSFTLSRRLIALDGSTPGRPAARSYIRYARLGSPPSRYWSPRRR